MEFENTFPTSPVKLTISTGHDLLGNYDSDDEDFIVGAPTPHTTVNDRTHTHLLILFGYYLLINPDFAPIERSAKKARTAMLFKDLGEDQKEHAHRSMPANVILEGYSWKCSTRMHSQKDDSWTAYYSCCHKADWERLEARMVVKTTRDFRLVLCNKFVMLVTYFIF